jgi:signal transduction histidine kinase
VLEPWVRVSVQDHGSGIPLEFQAKVFDSFTQADSSSTRSKGGTGLGLAITRQLLEHMGGRIAFSSEVGKGTTFYFELPLCDSISAPSILLCSAARRRA